MRKKTDRENLQRVLLYTVLWVCVIFYAFAFGVYATEKAEEERRMTTPQSPAVTAPLTRGAETEARATEDADTYNAEEAPVPDPMIEDTYLMVDHPLPLNLQVKLYGACLEFNVDYQLVLAMMDQETDFRNIMGDGGDSYGYMQVQRKWHEERMAQLGVTDLMDPESNFRVACHFLRECIDRYGDLEDALSYYNGGEPGGNVYSREVLEVYYG